MEDNKNKMAEPTKGALLREEKWKSGEGYDRYIQAELNSFRKQAWKDQICGHFNGEKGLRILDVGTGPGFLACILSEEGHYVTGIDASEGMLQCAEKNAEKLGVHPVFRKMDVNALDFPENTFDAIVTRNVTWTLEYPEEVYQSFRRILKPGGKLLIYDANWHMHFFDKDLYEKVRQHEADFLKKYGYREIVADPDYAFFETAPLTKTLRPQWDRRVLAEELHMEVAVEEDIGQHLYEPWEKELYAESPLFEVCAVKTR